MRDRGGGVHQLIVGLPCKTIHKRSESGELRQVADLWTAGLKDGWCPGKQSGYDHIQGVSHQFRWSHSMWQWCSNRTVGLPVWMRRGGGWILSCAKSTQVRPDAVCLTRDTPRIFEAYLGGCRLRIEVEIDVGDWWRLTRPWEYMEILRTFELKVSRN